MTDLAIEEFRISLPLESFTAYVCSLCIFLMTCCPLLTSYKPLVGYCDPLKIWWSLAIKGFVIILLTVYLVDLLWFLSKTHFFCWINVKKYSCTSSNQTSLMHRVCYIISLSSLTLTRLLPAVNPSATKIEKLMQHNYNPNLWSIILGHNQLC